MDLTISSHDTRRERIAYHIVVAAMLIPLVFGFLSQDLCSSVRPGLIISKADVTVLKNKLSLSLSLSLKKKPPALRRSAFCCFRTYPCMFCFSVSGFTRRTL
jgi:hypothetical protein